MIHDYCVSRAKREFLAQPRASRDGVIDDDIDRLTCVPIDATAEADLLAELAHVMADNQPVSVPKFGTIKRRMRCLRAGAAPGSIG